MLRQLLTLLLALSCSLITSHVMAMTIKLGVVTKPGSAQNIVAEKFADIVDSRTGGKISVLKIDLLWFSLSSFQIFDKNLPFQITGY